jgi:hypothetical protein
MQRPARWNRTFHPVGEENSAPSTSITKTTAPNPVVLIHGYPLSGHHLGEAGP